jgi:hypothetical protein
VQAAEERDQRAAHHHVVEVGDDEVGVVQVDVGIQRAEEQAGQAADREQEQERQRVEHRRVQRIEPLYSVASQLKTLIADGIATLKVIAEKIMFIRLDWPEVNMWWPHTRKLKQRDRDRGEGDEPVAEDVLAAEGPR